MTDWSKLKVVELKEECKSRNIPLSGLKLKQQFIDKLVEFEADQAVDTDNDQEEPENLPEEEKPENTLQEEGSRPEFKERELDADESVSDVPVDGRKDEQVAQKPTEGGDTGIDTGLSAEDKSTSFPDQKIEGFPDGKVEITQPESEAEANSEPPVEDVSKVEPELPMTSHEKTPISIVSASSNASSQVTTDLSDDQRKRKRRSVTPVPSTREITKKKAKANDGTPVIIGTTLVESTEVQEKEDRLSEIQSMGQANGGKTEKARSESNSLADDTASNKVEQRMPDHERVEASDQTPDLMQTESDEQDVPPARHPATSSLYMRNFKRPLHIPTLRNHIENLASKMPDDTSPVKTFYLDNIRTHGFVSFTSISAASRVRSAMHGKKFPDEPIREPIFVDFIPDDQVQKWTNIESSSQGPGRSGKRFEVVYHDGQDGVEAILQDSDSKQSSISNRMNIDQPKESLAGIHPDRLGLVPKDDLVDRSRFKQNSSGVGFKALDELFSSTTTKPKLYFKAVPATVANERLEMVRNLKLGHSAMGTSGDEGMKRFSFENIRGREEWIDKGPEFGFGRKGQDRLVGFRSRGGSGPTYRGGFGSRGGDSWRGRN